MDITNKNNLTNIQMTKSPLYKRIGIMGGTFDPIHYGHLVTAEAALHKFDLDIVYFVPSGNPPHKRNRRVSPALDRLMLTILATVTNPKFIVSEIEIQRKGFSYTIDTVREFQKMHPEAEIFFITGADAIMEIVSWMDADKLIETCQFIGATRPGYNLNEKMPEYLRRKVNLIEVPALSISSTDIRNRVKKGEPIHYLLPETVEMYIRKNRLYLEDADK